jgi:L-iditol 2-dehydrogenase
VKALLLTAPGRLEHVDLPDPQVGADDVLVRVKASGICGSDVHGMDGSSGRRIPPVVMGHEAAGAIEEVGRAVTGWRVGQAVTFDSTIYCGRCPYCRQGLVNLCDDRQVLGVSNGDYRRDGAFAERIAVPERVLHALPPGISMVEAALVEPLAVAAHAVSRAPLAGAEAVLVVGAGVIGLLIIQVLRAAGCDRIIAVDLSPARLAHARSMGATETLEPGDDVVGRVVELTGNRGVDVAFEAVGVGATLALATAAVRKGATVVLVGNLASSTELALQWTVTRQLTLAGSAASCGEYPQALELIATRRVDVGGLVSQVAPLADGATWFERLREPETPILKVVLEP